MNLPVDASDRISLLRVPLIVGVVFLHTYDPMISHSMRLQYVGWVKFLVNYVSEGLATLSVPLFFLLAGYLFFYAGDPSLTWFSRKILSRMKTLLIPLLFWNTSCLALMAMVQSTSASAPYFLGRSTPIALFTTWDYVNATIGVTTHPIAYQFWFVRDLIVLVILSPLVYFLVTTVPTLLFVVLFARWFSASAGWTIPFLSREAALFFCVGSILAIRKLNLTRIDRWASLAVMYLPLSIVDALTKEGAMSNPIHKTAELFGVAFLLCLTRLVRTSSFLRTCLIALSPASFFVFATHEPLLTAVRKLSYGLWPPLNSVRLVALYFADPLLVVAFSTVLYFACLKAFPVATGVITGGRSILTVRRDATVTPVLQLSH